MMDANKFSDIIKELSNLKLDESNSDTVRSILDRLLKRSLAAPIYDFQEGKVIMRARCVTLTDNVKFSHELSYVPAEENTKYQRASSPNQTMFYGIVSDTKDSQFVGCLNEACACFRNPSPKDGIYYAIVSLWVVREAMSFFTIINPDSSGNKSEYLKKMSKELHAFIEDHKDILDKDDVIAFQKFMFEEYNKKALSENDYWIPAMITSGLIKSDVVDGVLYESAQVIDPKLDNVLCLAVKPESVDKKLSFLSAIKATITFQDRKPTLQFDSINIARSN